MVKWEMISIRVVDSGLEVLMYLVDGEKFEFIIPIELCLDALEIWYASKK